MGEETEFRFDDNSNVKKKSAIAEFGRFLWNSNTKEFCGRDGASWGKVSLFYAVFYFCLGSFFVGMLAVFFQIMPKDRPTYFGESGTISSRKLNPGLGFRPQIDVEDNLISFNPQIAEGDKTGYKKYVKNLQNFLDAKYNDQADENNLIECESGKTYESDLRNGKSCRFNYKKMFENTPCSEEKQYGYNTANPCVLVKLNKMIDYVPLTNGSGKVEIRCYQDTAADKDNIKGVTYYSENGESKESGTIDAKYFPFYAQKEYRAPFVWAQFDVSANVLVNIECRAYADNIEHERMTRRGLTKIVIKVQN
jgi:sodium/potassium-transporting ATPase subunit beta